MKFSFKHTESTINSKFKKLLSEVRGFKLIVLPFKKIKSEDKTKFDNFYLSSKAEIIINESEIDDMFESIYSTNISNIQNL